nr:cytochrome P450 81E8-like [Ipomoea batatas]
MEIQYYIAPLLSVLLIVLIRMLFSGHGKNPPPTPLALPIVGHLYLIKNSLHQSLASLSAKHGPVLHLRFGCRSFLVVSSPSAVEQCFTKNDIVFANRPRTMAGDNFSFNYKALVWAPYGDLWRTQRRLAAVELLSAASLQRSSIIREDEIRTVIRSLFRLTKNGRISAVDFTSLAGAFTFNAMMRIISGERFVEEEEMGGEKGREIIDGLRELFFASILGMNACDFFPVLRWFGYGGLEKKMAAVSNRRIEMVSRLLDEFRRKNVGFSDSDGGEKTTVIGTLLRLQKSEPEFYTDDVVMSIILCYEWENIGEDKMSAARLSREALQRAERVEVLCTLRKNCNTPYFINIIILS